MVNTLNLVRYFHAIALNDVGPALLKGLIAKSLSWNWDGILSRIHGLQLLGADLDGTCTDGAIERVMMPACCLWNPSDYGSKGHTAIWG